MQSKREVTARGQWKESNLFPRSAHIGAQLGSLPSRGAGSTRASLVCGGGSASVMSTGACSALLDRGVVISSWFARRTFCGGVSRGLCGLRTTGLSTTVGACSFCQLRCILQLVLRLEPDLPESTRRGSDSERPCPSVHFLSWQPWVMQPTPLAEGLSRHRVDIVTSCSDRETPKKHIALCTACAGFSSLTFRRVHLDANHLAPFSDWRWSGVRCFSQPEGTVPKARPLALHPCRTAFARNSLTSPSCSLVEACQCRIQLRSLWPSFRSLRVNFSNLVCQRCVLCIQELAVRLMVSSPFSLSLEGTSSSTTIVPISALTRDAPAAPDTCRTRWHSPAPPARCAGEGDPHFLHVPLWRKFGAPRMHIHSSRHVPSLWSRPGTTVTGSLFSLAARGSRPAPLHVLFRDHRSGRPTCA